MSDLLQTIIAWLNEVSGNNQMIAGAISLWGLGVGSYLARHVPGVVWKFLVRQFTVDLTMQSADHIYDQFMDWYHQTGRSRQARTLIAQNVYLSNDDDRDMVGDDSNQTMLVSAGYGMHFFFFGGRIFRMTLVEKESHGIYGTKQTVTITSIGRSQKLFRRLLSEVNPPRVVCGTKIYKWNGREWNFLREQPARPFETVVIPKPVREDLLRHLNNFREQKSWYIDNGVPYRTGIMLHGLSGSGKTSLAMGLCSYLQADLYLMNPNALASPEAESALGRLTDKCVVLMEDIDTYRVTRARNGPTELAVAPPGYGPPAPGGPVEPKGASGPSLMESLTEGTSSELTLSALLNAIDGASSSSGRILIATTNHYARLDRALVRRGRFDKTIELGYVNAEGFREFFSRFYPGFKFPRDTVFPDKVVASDVQAVIFEHREDPEGALEALINRQSINTCEESHS